MHRHAGQRALLGRPAVGGFFLFLLGLNFLPQAFDRLRILRLLAAEYMRMPADQLGGDRLDHVAEIERALLLRHAGVKDDLQQQIAKFVLKVGKIVARNGIRDLVGFFERIGCDGREVLLRDPTGSRSWASAVPP